MAFTHEELDFLIATPQAVEQASQLALTKKSMVKDITVLKKNWGDHARALAELVVSRRSLSNKIGEGDWFVDTDSAQQATPAAVARFRADYLKNLGATSIADVTCSIGTELLHSHVPASGSDLDGVRVRMARENLASVGKPAAVVQADALRPVWTHLDVVIADPARRNSSGRIATLKDLMPPLPELFETYPKLVVKCAPGLDVSDVEEWAGQVDFISVNGDMKEACVYSASVVGELGASNNNRRAIVLTSKDGEDSKEIWTHAMPDEACDVRPVGRYIIDPDAAIIRAGLVRQYGHAHGLWQIDEHIAYLSGDTVPAGVRGFEVLEEVPLRQVKGALAARGVGSAEILVRGVDVDPDVLRKKWKLKGQNAVSVIIARVDSADKRQAYICQPTVGGSDN